MIAHPAIKFLHPKSVMSPCESDEGLFSYPKRQAYVAYTHQLSVHQSGHLAFSVDKLLS